MHGRMAQACRDRTSRARRPRQIPVKRSRFAYRFLGNGVLSLRVRLRGAAEVCAGRTTALLSCNVALAWGGGVRRPHNGKTP